MTQVEIIRCTDPTELYHHYDGQNAPQPVYIELDLEDGQLLADWNGEIGNGVPAPVFHGIRRRYTIPILTGTAANRVMREIAPLAQRILEGASVEWDGRNMVGRLDPGAQAAEDEIKERLGVGGFADEDLVAVWDIEGATNGNEAEEYGITANTSDKRIGEIETEITRDLMSVSNSGVAVVPDLGEYLRDLRADATAS